MTELMIVRNFVAHSAIDEGDVIAFYGANSAPGGACEVAPVANTNSACLGIAVKPASAGELVTFLPFISGKIIPVKVAGSITAGDMLSVSSAGVVTAAATNLKLPLQAVDGGSAGDLIRAMVCVLMDAVPSA